MANGESRSADPQSDGPVPKAVVSRLSLHLRELQHLIRDGQDTTSSTQLGNRLGFTDAQVRKDLAFFGQFGNPGIGYKCDELIRQVKRILGTDRWWRLASRGSSTSHPPRFRFRLELVKSPSIWRSNWSNCHSQL